MKFFKIFLATLLAMVVGTVLSWVLCLIVFVGMAGSMGQTTQAVITPQTIVKIDLAEISPRHRPKTRWRASTTPL